jgi:hypothetical protein
MFHLRFSESVCLSKCSMWIDAEATSCGLHCRLHVGFWHVRGAHISQCIALYALLRPGSCRPAQQLVLLLSQRLAVCRKQQGGLQVLPAVQQLDICLHSAAHQFVFAYRVASCSTRGNSGSQSSRCCTLTPQIEAAVAFHAMLPSGCLDRFGWHTAGTWVSQWESIMHL